jgi:transcription elongation GreA/GreB family factor
MNKKSILDNVISQINIKLEKQQTVVNDLSRGATHSEMKQEGKYDTRATEAAYLVGAQKRRLQEIKIELEALKLLSTGIDQLRLQVQVGSLVTVQELSIKSTDKQTYFITPLSSAACIGNIQIISTNSPIFLAMKDLTTGDCFERLKSAHLVEFEITLNT